jgi:hypothetical protein
VAHGLELQLVDEADGAAVADSTVRVEAPDLSFSLSSDAHGHVSIEIPDRPPYLTLHVQKDGFVPKLIVWDLRLPDLLLPDRFTLPMERGKTIGGFVRNENREPVEGAHVLICLRGSRQRDRTAPRVENDIWEIPASTDSQGRWQFDEAGDDLQFLHIRLEHPEYISNEYIDALPPAQDFKNGTAVLTLLKGVPCEGVVTDEQGQPLEAVEVISGEAGSGSPSTPTRVTDARGYFRFGGVSLKWRGEKPILSFRKEGYAPELIELQPAASGIRTNVVLRAGKSLRVRFIDKEGAPIGGVVMAINHWREHRPFHVRFLADETGLLLWEHAPEDAVGFAVLHEAYQNQDVRLTAADEIQTVVLRRHARISGRVVDAQTKRPIPVFRLIMGRCFHEERTWSDWSHQQARTFRDGHYQISATRPVAMMNPQGGPGEIGYRRLRIEAAGYQPSISREIANEEERVECDFELVAGTDLEGTVRDANGDPVSGAELIVGGSANPVVVRNGAIWHKRHFSVGTDERGRYVLPPQEETFSLLLIHPDAGYLITSWSELQAAPDVRLLAWGRLELATTANDPSRAKYYLRPVLDRAHGRNPFRFESTPVLTPEGFWLFTGLRAGQMQLDSNGEAMNEGPMLTIENGRTTRLDLRAGRRGVVGQILLPAEGVSTEEPLAHLRLRPRATEPPMPPGLNPSEREAWLLAWHNTPEGRQHRRNFSEKTFTIDSQGRFRLDDLAPGFYKLVAIFFRNMPTGRDATADVVGAAARDFELPAGDGEFDLGQLPVFPPSDARPG